MDLHQLVKYTELNFYIIKENRELVMRMLKTTSKSFSAKFTKNTDVTK